MNIIHNICFNLVAIFSCLFELSVADKLSRQQVSHYLASAGHAWFDVNYLHFINECCFANYIFKKE